MRKAQIEAKALQYQIAVVRLNKVIEDLVKQRDYLVKQIDELKQDSTVLEEQLTKWVLEFYKDRLDVGSPSLKEFVSWLNDMLDILGGLD